MKTPITVGILREDYNWRRNITGHDHEAIRFKRVTDAFSALDTVLNRINRPSSYYRNAHSSVGLPRVDLFHFWRVVSYGDTPWIVSSSNGLPSGWPNERMDKALKLLASDKCKRIILTSKNAFDWQLRKAESRPDLLPLITEKMEVLPPPQDIQVDSWEEKDLASPVTFTLIGKHFFRKGGLETLHVVDRLLTEGAQLRLNIVSELSLDRHSGSTHADVVRAREIIDRHDQIHCYDRLPNEEVLSLLRESHIGLLPSYVETYGYTVLEAQACACPVITTDVFAFPEINGNEVGWAVPIDGPDYAYDTDDGRQLISEKISKGLYETMCSILDEPEIIRKKGDAALSRIRRDHDPAAHADRLLELYRAAIDPSVAHT